METPFVTQLSIIFQSNKLINVYKQYQPNIIQISHTLNIPSILIVMKLPLQELFIRTVIINIVQIFLLMDLESSSKHKQNSKNSIEDINPIMLLKQPDRFKSTFYQLTCEASEALKIQNYQVSIQTLTKCVEMLDVTVLLSQLGKAILKDISKYWKVCIYANLACSFQGQWKVQKSHRYCDKVEEEFKKLLQSGLNKQTELKIHRHIIRLRFQHCALISQLDQHQKALQLCKSTIPKLIQVIETILKYSHESRKQCEEGNAKQIETVQFRTKVCDYAEGILNYLLSSLKQEVQIKKEKSSFYYWQKNPERNQEQVKKKFVPTENQGFKRSILGVNRTKHWIDDFNIGGIMHMSEITLSDFQNPIPIEEYLFKDQLYQLIINCSVAHFTIATQMRFIDSARQKIIRQQRQKNKSDKKMQELSKTSNIASKKYRFEQKSQLFKLSQAYHLKSIDIISYNIKFTVPYIQHLIQSYDKHYIQQKQLQPIAATAEQSLLTINNSINFKPLEQQQVINFKGLDEQQMKQKKHEFLNEMGRILSEQNERCGDYIEEADIYYNSNNAFDEIKPKLCKTDRMKGDMKNKSLGKFKSTKNVKNVKKVIVQFDKQKNMKKKPKDKDKDKDKIKQFDGQKQYRIKLQSETRIIVLKKKK